MKILNNDKCVGNIFVTYDYDKFTIIQGNRTINNTHYRRLKASMAKEQLISPIIVNENMEIIDGQHRFKAERELGLPVYYAVVDGYTLPQVRKYNEIMKNWGFNDFLYTNELLNDENIIQFNRLCNEYNISTSALRRTYATLIQKSENIIIEEMKTGNFKFENIEDIIKLLDELNGFKKFDKYNSSPFISAYLKLRRQETFDYDFMIKQFNKYINNVGSYRTVGEYLSCLCEIYSNHKDKNRKNILYSVNLRKFVGDGVKK